MHAHTYTHTRWEGDVGLYTALESRRHSLGHHDLCLLSRRQPAALKSLTYLGGRVLFEGKQNWTQAKLSSGWKTSALGIFYSLSSPPPICPPVPTLMNVQASAVYLEEVVTEVKHATAKERTSVGIASLLPSSHFTLFASAFSSGTQFEEA